MIVLLYMFIIIFDWIPLVVFPLFMIMNFFRFITTEDQSKLIASPILFMKPLTIKKGFCIWVVFMLLSVSVLFEYVNWHLTGISPFIPL